MRRTRKKKREDQDANAKRARIEENKSQLLLAAGMGDFEVVQTLINNSPVENGERAELINAEWEGGWTILHRAANFGYLQIVEWILSDAGGRAAGFTKIVTRAFFGKTALLLALEMGGKIDIALAIIMGCKVENGERAAMLNAVDDAGRTVLHYAAGCTPLIRWLLSDSGGRAAEFTGVLATGHYGETALHRSLAPYRTASFLAIVEGCKVENGERAAMLNAVDNRGQNLLHIAAMNGHWDILLWLLSDKGREAGFDRDNLFALTGDNQSILHLAATWRLTVDCFDRILSSCKNAEERGKLLFGTDDEGRTVLHCTIRSGVFIAVVWVISHQQEERGGSNEDLFVLTNNKESVLHFGATREENEIFDFLLSRCNNTSERSRLFLGRDKRGWTIFHHAARFCEYETIAHILRKYPEESKMIINARDNRGMTALHRIIVGGIDEESRKEWGDWDGTFFAANVFSLLGFENVDQVSPAATSNNEEGGDKNPVDVPRTIVVVAAAGADPNLGLKFE